MRRVGPVADRVVGPVVRQHRFRVVDAEERAEIARRIAYVPQLPPPLAVPVGEWIAAITRLRGLAAGAIPELAERLQGEGFDDARFISLQ